MVVGARPVRASKAVILVEGVAAPPVVASRSMLTPPKCFSTFKNKERLSARKRRVIAVS